MPGTEQGPSRGSATAGRSRPRLREVSAGGLPPRRRSAHAVRHARPRAGAVRVVVVCGVDSPRGTSPDTSEASAPSSTDRSRQQRREPPHLLLQRSSPGRGTSPTGCAARGAAARLVAAPSPLPPRRCRRFPAALTRPSAPRPTALSMISPSPQCTCLPRGTRRRRLPRADAVGAHNELHQAVVDGANATKGGSLQSGHASGRRGGLSGHRRCRR